MSLARLSAIARIGAMNYSRPMAAVLSRRSFGAQMQRQKSDRINRRAEKAMARAEAEAEAIAAQAPAGPMGIPEADIVVLTSREGLDLEEESPKLSELRAEFGRRLVKHASRSASMDEDLQAAKLGKDATQAEGWATGGTEKFEARLNEIKEKLAFYKSLDKTVLSGSLDGKRKSRKAGGEVGEKRRGLNEPGKLRNVLNTMMDTGRLNAELFQNICNFGSMKGFTLDSMMPVDCSVASTMARIMQNVAWFSSKSDDDSIEGLFDFLIQNMRDNVNEENRREFWTNFRASEGGESFLHLIAKEWDTLEWLVDDSNTPESHQSIPKACVYDLMTSVDDENLEYPLHYLLKNGKNWTTKNLHSIMTILSPLDDAADDFWMYKGNVSKKNFLHYLCECQYKSTSEKIAIMRALERDYISPEAYQAMLCARDRDNKRTPFQALIASLEGDESMDVDTPLNEEVMRLLTPDARVCKGKKVRDFWCSGDREFGENAFHFESLTAYDWNNMMARVDDADILERALNAENSNGTSPLDGLRARCDGAEKREVKKFKQALGKQGIAL